MRAGTIGRLYRSPAHEPPARGLRPHRRLPDGGARCARRLDRLAVLAELRQRRVLCRPPRHRAERPLAHRAARGRADKPALPSQHAHPRDRVRDRGRRRRAHRLHAAARQRVRRGAHRRGPARQGRDAHRADPALRLRQHRAVGAAPRGRHAEGHRRARHDGAAHADPAARRRAEERRPLHRGEGRARALRHDLRPLAPAAAAGDRPAGRARGHGGVLARMDRAHDRLRRCTTRSCAARSSP